MTIQNLQQSNDTPLITAVIVSYRSWGKLKACLDSLINAKLASARLEIVVVDNCSHDGQFEAFQQQYPSVSFVLNQGNFGFSNGCNKGANLTQGDYLFFINPDTEVPPNVLEKLYLAIQKLPCYSIIATQKRSKSGKFERVERFFPRWYTMSGIGKSIHRTLNKKRIKQDFSKHKTMVYPDWVSGSVIFMRRKDFEQLNGWDERFWMYCEDVDLCKRATLQGGKITLLQDTEIVHNHGGSSRINPITSALTKSEVYISRHVYTSIHNDGISLYLIQCMFATKSLVKVSLMALLSLLALNHPKAQMLRLLFLNLVHYYWRVSIDLTWLSPRSRQHKHVLQTDAQIDCENIPSTDEKI